MTGTAVESALIEVAFKGNRKEFFRWTGDVTLTPRTAVIVAVDRGEDLGYVHASGELAEQRKAGTTHGKESPAELRQIVRVATPRDLERAASIREDEEVARRTAIGLARDEKLDMKISDAEWQWDRRRLTLYFTAEQRVDFRQMVRQLEKQYSTRVQMWHIGVRDEAKRLDGIGRCGRQFCSASWLPDLRPVKSSVAKDQRLSTLNPTQISGACGRLMCCLRYEHEFYVQSRKRFPKEGKILVTAVGDEKVVQNDIFRDQVTLRNPAGDFRTIPLAQLRRELGEAALPVEEELPSRENEGEEEPELVTLRRPARPERPAREPRAERPPRPERPRQERPAQPPQAQPVVPPPAPDETHAMEDSSDESGDSSATGANPLDANATDAERARRSRRRRGRRGGRRGKGPDGGPAAPSGDSSPSAPTP